MGHIQIILTSALMTIILSIGIKSNANAQELQETPQAKTQEAIPSTYKKPAKSSTNSPKTKRVDRESKFKKIDSNKDGVVTKDEFLATTRSKNNPKKATVGFLKLDKNNDGSISLEEFKTPTKKQKN